LALAPKIGIDPETEFEEYEFLLSTVKKIMVSKFISIFSDDKNRTP